MKITIPGNPFSQKRHRTNGYRRYDPSAKDKKTIRKQLLPIKPPKPLESNLKVTIWAYFQTPKSWSKKKQKEVEGTFRAKTPDVDNVCKILFDAMNGMIFKDDKQVVFCHISKYYSMNPRTEIEIKEIG